MPKKTKDFTEQYLVKPDSHVKLAKWDANDKEAFDGGKEEAQAELKKLNAKLEALQELLYVEHQHKVLVILQGMDTSGKDGVIRRVFEGVNPAGVHVASFKPPTAEEQDHDFLWRVHKQIPAKGELAIFNRSHYEEVLVVRVRKLEPPEKWKKHFDQINDFERMLAENGTTILKFYLHIDRDEQKKQLQQRLDDPTKQWKFDPMDLDDRQHWTDYMEAYEDVLNKTSTRYAPWYIVPSNHKWYRDLLISSVLVNTLEGLHMNYPKPKVNLDDIVIE